MQPSSFNFTSIPHCQFLPTCLQGILFCDRMKGIALEEARESLTAMEESFMAANPGAKVQRIPVPKVQKGF